MEEYISYNEEPMKLSKVSGLIDDINTISNLRKDSLYKIKGWDVYVPCNDNLDTAEGFNKHEAKVKDMNNLGGTWIQFALAKMPCTDSVYLIGETGVGKRFIASMRYTDWIFDLQKFIADEAGGRNPGWPFDCIVFFREVGED